MSIPIQVLRALWSPRCARELAEHLGIPTKSAQTGLLRLQRRGLVACMTPGLRQCRMYARTVRGRLVAGEAGAVPVTVEVPGWYLELHAQLQAGRLRRRLLSALHTAIDSRALRRQLIAAGHSMGMSHLYATLRWLQRHRVVVRDGAGRWGLTPLGERLRRYAKFESLEGPAADATGIGRP